MPVIRDRLKVTSQLLPPDMYVYSAGIIQQASRRAGRQAAAAAGNAILFGKYDKIVSLSGAHEAPRYHCRLMPPLPENSPGIPGSSTASLARYRCAAYNFDPASDARFCAL